MRKSLIFLLFTLSVATATAAFAPRCRADSGGAKRSESGLVHFVGACRLPPPSPTYFQNKYKGIEVEVHRTGSQRVLQRVMQETAAGIKNADIDSYLRCRPFCVCLKTKAYC